MESRHYVHPGQLVASAEPMVVHTVLGSCVAVCLWDDQVSIGGMNHFVLPESSSGSRSCRFAAPAIEELIARLISLGASPQRLQAKLFGGSALLPTGQGPGSIGGENVRQARKLLAARAIPVVAEDVLGRNGRKVLFETGSGAAWVRLLGEAAA
jgi:chemotaxis protein CheD